MADYAKEGGHWYDREGTPRYTITGKNGKERNTTLRDARTQHLVPSVTEVLKLLPKPALERWKIEQVKLACLTLPQIKGETLDEFSQRIYSDANAQSKVARETGTAIHGAIEKHFMGDFQPDYLDILSPLMKLMDMTFGEHEQWNCEKSFSCDLGYGGKVDLHSPNWVIDFKTKEFTKDDLKKKFSFKEHIMQLSAYRLGLGYPEARIANVFISVKDRGLIKVEIHDQDETDSFLALLHFWKTYKKFDPSYI